MRKNLASLVLGTAALAGGCSINPSDIGNESISADEYTPAPMYGATSFSYREWKFRGASLIYDFEGDEKIDIYVVSPDGWEGDTEEFRRQCREGSNPSLKTFITPEAKYQIETDTGELRKKIRENLSDAYIWHAITTTPETDEYIRRADLESLRKIPKGI